jgi:hypothetical protein
MMTGRRGAPLSSDYRGTSSDLSRACSLSHFLLDHHQAPSQKDGEPSSLTPLPPDLNMQPSVLGASRANQGPELVLFSMRGFSSICRKGLQRMTRATRPLHLSSLPWNQRLFLKSIPDPPPVPSRIDGARRPRRAISHHSKKPQ